TRTRGCARPGVQQCSKPQSSFARAVGERLDAAVVEIAAAVEDDRLDAGLLACGREQLADLGRLLGLRALERLLELPEAGGGKCLVLDVVHELGGDAAVRAEDDEARPLGR